MIRDILYNFYLKLQKLIVPGLNNSQFVYKKKLGSTISENVLWLDLGCGHQIFPDWMPDSIEEQNNLVSKVGMAVGIDYDIPSLKKNNTIGLKVCGNLQRLPFKRDIFNYVTANMVVEHLNGPAEFLSELNRILKPGAILVFHTPNILNYGTLCSKFLPHVFKKGLIRILENRMEEDVFPTYYRFNSVSRIKKIAMTTGFTIQDIELANSTAETSLLGPIVIFELLLIRLTNLKIFAKFRSSIIVVLQKTNNESE